MKISVKGPIIDSDDQWIYDWFEVEATSPKKVIDLLNQAKNNEDLEVEINSGGGSVFAGSEIYTALKSYSGKVTTKVVGLAASAASVIAMAGDKIEISPTGQIMIHNASGGFGGDYRDMEKGAEILKNVNATISNAYSLKTGLSNEELLEMMNKETWLTPQQALEKKFVDEIMFTNDIKLVASINNGMLPQEVINKMKMELINKEVPKEPENNIEAEKAKLLMELDLI
ncbi:head maturation protease, ClpP-related [Clostridium tertium]|uniref:head maturation protease, ClpP-related n=1 Tax=Clostridium tertium TaxID=1559 RepID=UPI002A7F8FA2|nr:head maturation protease, ClpP-related [Clostridium tertium]MDY4605267.1 Clp protease ClpP [Clostridium tertium]